MKNLNRKKIIVIIFLVLACMFMALSAIGSYFVMIFTDKTSEAVSQSNAFIKTYDDLIYKELLDSSKFNEDLLTHARLFASAIKQDDPSSLEPMAYGTGYIIRVEGDEVTLPDGFPEDIDLGPAPFSEEYSSWGIEGQYTAFAHISGPFYYVESSADEAYEAGEIHTDITSALSDLADANDCDYIYLAGSKPTADTNIYIGTNAYCDYQKVSDIGLTADSIDYLSKNRNVMAKVDGSVKWISLVHPDGYSTEACIMVIQDVRKILLGSTHQAIIIMIITMIISITLAVWILSVLHKVNEDILTEEQREKYNPKKLKQKMASALVFSTFLVFIASAFIISLDCLFIESTQEKTILNEFTSRLADDDIRTEEAWKSDQDRYINTAKELAALIDDHRHLQNADWLRQAAKIINADYITIYDTDGDEVISSSRYRGMSLGKDEDSATYDFRRLLRGVRNISHSGVTDEITGLTRDMHGISLRYLSDSQAYGALIIAVDPKKQSSEVFSDINETASAMAPVEGFIAGVDPGTGIIKYCSDEKKRGADMADICSEIESYSGSFMGLVNIQGTEYYVSSAEHDGIIYYCGVTENEMFSGALNRALNTAIRFLLVGALLALILFSGYNQQSFSELVEKSNSSAGKRISIRAKQVVKSASESSGDLSRERSAFLQSSYLAFLKDGISPEQRARGVFRFLIFVTVCVICVFAFLDRSSLTAASANDDVIEYIIHGDWKRGFNLFSVAAILLLSCILTAGLYLLRYLAGILYLTMNTESRTTFMLIINIIQYSAVIVAVYLSLGYLGVDTRALVASAGLAGVAIALGARDLIADIIAGIMILVDNTYHIGDIVSVGGFRGEVAEIGMRSTKIIGRGDNIKTIRNSSVGDVINYSRLNSWYPLILTISTSEDLDAIEAMLQEELPKISRRYPDMVNGPEFRGVDSINGAKTTILILTECKESNYNQVQRDVNREVRKLFKAHNIELL